MTRLSCRLLVFVVAAMGLACAAAAAAAAPQPGENQSRHAPSPASADLQVIHAEPDKDVAASLKPYIQQGQHKVERFFSQPFKQAFEVEVLPDRVSKTAHHCKPSKTCSPRCAMASSTCWSS
jgi:hypothetical protein